MNRRHISAWAAVATTFAVLVGSQSAQAAIVDNQTYLLNHASDWVVSLDVTPDGQYVFVSNYTDGSISRFDTTSSTVTNTPSSCGHPYGVAVSPDGASVAVACAAANAIVYFNVDTLVPQITPGGNSPIAVAYNHSGSKLYSTSETDDLFREVDATNRFSVNTLTITGTGWQAPFYVAISPDDTKAYVSNIVSGTVSEISLGTLAVTRTFTGFSAPLGLAVTADGSGLWVSNSDVVSDTVNYIDLGTGAVSHTVTVGHGPREIALSPDGSQLAVANGGDSTISLIDTETFTVTATQNVGDPAASSHLGVSGPWGIKYSHDGWKLYVANEYNGTLQAFTLDPALGGEIQNTSGGGQVEKLVNTGGPSWEGLAGIGTLLCVAGALTLVAMRRRKV